MKLRFLSFYFFFSQVGFLISSVPMLGDCYISSFRYYDPKLGRFIQMDTVAPSASSVGLNRMRYAKNNPLKYIDPDGHVPQDPQDLEDQGWEPTEFYFVEVPDDRRNVLNLDRAKEYLNKLSGGAGEFTYDPKNIRGQEFWYPDFNFIRFYMKKNEGFDQDTAQAQIFESFQVALTGDPVYYNPQADPRAADFRAYATKFVGYDDRNFRNTEHSSFYAYGIVMLRPFFRRGYSPVGYNGELILTDELTIFAHEIGHVFVEKSFLNAFSQMSDVVQDKTGFPLPVLTRMATHITIEDTDYAYMYGPAHPSNVREDLMPGTDPVMQYGNLARRALNEQLKPGEEKYAPRHYYYHKTGQYVRKRNEEIRVNGEERMKDY